MVAGNIFQQNPYLTCKVKGWELTFIPVVRLSIKTKYLKNYSYRPKMVVLLYFIHS